MSEEKEINKISTKEECLAFYKELTKLADVRFMPYYKMAIEALEQEPCNDCISRAYIESIVEELENICINGDEHILSLLSNIKNAPSVTPARPKGHWIDTDATHSQCSRCGAVFEIVSANGEANYCPNCGVDMRGDIYD